MKEGMIFIEKAFWAKLSSVRERYAILDKLIHSQSDIYTNYNKEEISCDTILGLIYDETGGRLYWGKDLNDYIESDDIVSLSSIFLTNENAVSCDGISLQRGIVVFNNIRFSEDTKVFTGPTIIPIDEDTKYYHGWKNDIFAPVLSSNKCNSIIINDKYLCNKGYVSQDLKDILDIVIPQKLDIAFHLSIFSEVNSNGDSIYQDIKKTLSSIRSKDFCDKTSFTLYYSTLHDRFIISNTFYMTVGAGFALFNGRNKAQNSTSLKFFYQTAVGNKLEYYLWLKKTKEVAERTQNFWGDRTNRLFELV